MENLKLWIISLCGATVISSIFKIVVENSSLKKVVNIFLSLFVLFYTVIPIAKFTDNFQIESSISSSNFEDVYVEGYEKIIKSSIISECEKISVDVDNIKIASSLDDDSNLSVKSIEISISDASKTDEVKNQIKKNLGFEVSVI